MTFDCLDIYVSQRHVGTVSRNVDGGFDFCVPAHRDHGGRDLIDHACRR